MNQSSDVKSNNKWIIGIVGTGTMGMGIAQVAASAGHLVFLYDARPGIAQLAIEQIGDSLKKQVVKTIRNKVLPLKGKDILDLRYPELKGLGLETVVHGLLSQRFSTNCYNTPQRFV